MNNFLSLRGSDRTEFYRSKFNHYKRFNSILMAIEAICSVSYFASDCIITNSIPYSFLFIRSLVLIPLIIYYIVNVKFSTKFMPQLIMSCVIGQTILWCTIAATWRLPDQSFAGDGLVIIQLAFFIQSFASTFELSVLSQITVLISIIISTFTMPIYSASVISSICIPCIIALSFVSYMITQSYYESYIITRRLSNLSYVDQLTGVYNRHKLDELVTNNKLNITRLTDVSFILIDIDFFKKINDTYGHDKGDIVLAHLASILTQNVRKQDFVIRWGGEEFLIILYDCNERQAFKIAEKIRKKVLEYDNGIQKITISLGICEYNGLDYKESVNKADQALYTAKNNGRNKSICYSKIDMHKQFN